MLKLDAMCMVGSAGANVGKTELVCALIKRLSENREIVGIKVTTIKAKDGQCPRGGRGCGVCSSLDGDFCITEEGSHEAEFQTDSNPRKDTARLLAAGASRVFWLRVMKTHLQDGLTALLDIIGPDAVSICESNSLRHVVEPGLFIMVKRQGQKLWKSSARDVKKYVDEIVTSTSSGFDFDISRIKFVDGKWVIKQLATAIILAGGDSARIGQDKSMLPINGQPMIKCIVEQLIPYFDQILISSNDVPKYSFLGVEVVPDKIAGWGPLMGIASALKVSRSEVNFVIASDIPEIDIAFVRTMLRQAESYDAVVPKTGPSRYEPLFAVYRKDTLAAIEDALSLGKHRIMDAFGRCKVKYIDFSRTGTGRLRNLNTMNDYLEFVKRGKNDIDV